MSSRRLRLRVSLLALLLFAAGCSGSDSDPGSAIERDARPGASQTGDRPDRPVKGGFVTLGLERPRSLDPAEASLSARSELVVADLLFDGLTRYDPETGEAAPALAGRFVGRDGLQTWSFRLRQGARFSDGRPVRAADVKYSIERVALLGGPLQASQLELVDGYTAVVQGRTTQLAGVRALEPDLVEIRLQRPLATLPLLLASPVFGIVPSQAGRERPGLGAASVGSGPFRLVDREGNVLHLERAPGSSALLDGVNLIFFDSADDSYRAFVAGSVDWSRVPTDKVDEAAERFGTEGFRPFHAELFYGFNLKLEKFSDPRFREAIVRAIDRQAIVSAIYSGSVELINGVVVQGIEGHADDACAKCGHDPERARELVREAFGSAPPPRVGIDYDEGTVEGAVAKAIAEDLEDVGIPVKLRPRTFSDYQEFAASGLQQLFRGGWFGAYRSPDAFLFPLFWSRSDANVTGFSDGAVDHWLTSARAEADPERRKRLYGEAEQMIMDKLPILPIAQFETQAVVASRVRGLELQVDGTFDATRVWVTDGR